MRCLYPGTKAGFYILPENLTHLKLLAESAGAMELHDVLHKLLHCERLVTVWNQKIAI